MKFWYPLESYVTHMSHEDLQGAPIESNRILKDNDQERELIYYPHRDFLATWPEEITNISHIMGQGSVDTDVINKIKGLTFRKMFEERTTDVFYYYALYFSHKHFDKLIIL